MKIKKRIITSILFTILLAIPLIGCKDTKTNELEINTNTINSEKIDEKYNFKNVDEIASSNLSIEEQYEAAVSLIDIETYLTQEYDNIIPITPFEALEKMENGENFIVYHGRSECRYCKYVYPGIAEIAPENLSIYYVNTDYFRFLYPKDENSELFLYVKDLHENYKTIFDFTGVPNIKYVKNNEIAISLSNPLSAEFFDENTTKETKEEILEEMKVTILYYLDYMNKDMNENTNNIDGTTTQKVTIIK